MRGRGLCTNTCTPTPEVLLGLRHEIPIPGLQWAARQAGGILQTCPKVNSAPGSLPAPPRQVGRQASVETVPQPKGRAQGCLDLRFKAERKLSLNGRATCLSGPKEDGGELLVKLYSFLLFPSSPSLSHESHAFGGASCRARAGTIQLPTPGAQPR